MLMCVSEFIQEGQSQSVNYVEEKILPLGVASIPAPTRTNPRGYCRTNRVNQGIGRRFSAVGNWYVNARCPTVGGSSPASVHRSALKTI